MASRRRIEAYERKLAKIATEGKPLDADCLMAVATVYDFHEEDERTGVLVGFSQEVAQGLWGPRRSQRIRLCPSCVHHRPAEACPSVESLPVIRDPLVLRLERNTDGTERWTPPTHGST